MEAPRSTSRDGSTPGDPTAPHTEDHALARRALRGEVAARDLLCERLRCVPRIVHALNQRAGRPLNEHDLADLTQDTLLLVWRKLETYGDSSSLETWSFGVARFEFLNAVRRARRPRLPLSEIDPAGRSRPESEADDELDAGALLTAFDGLGPEELALLRLKHLEGLTFDQIGARLELSPNTVKTRYYRGLTRLRQRWRARSTPGGQGGVG